MRTEREGSSSLDGALDILGFEMSDKPEQFVPIASFEHNSLDLVINTSVDNVFPISRAMLSRSEDAFHPQHRQYQQKSPKCTARPFEKQLQALSQLQDLNSDKLLSSDHPDFKVKQHNKNVLRNFGNAQNHYVLYNQNARQYIKRNINDIESFDSWVRGLKLQNFEQFQGAWTNPQVRLFTRVYKQLCWQFYTFNAVPYVLESRIKKQETKISHLRQIHRFLEGLADPQQFISFGKP